MMLEGSSAIVTGGAGGLGAATVRQLVASGLRVVVFDRDAEHAGGWPTSWATPPLAVGGDVTDDDDVAAAIDAAQVARSAVGPRERGRRRRRRRPHGRPRRDPRTTRSRSSPRWR